MKQKLLKLSWVDQITPDPEKTADFYSELFGFGQESVDEGNGRTSFSLIDEDGNEVFGIVDDEKFKPKDWATGWVLYFEVDNFEEQCAKIEQMGGSILYRAEKREGGCLFQDPSGAPVFISPVCDVS